MQTPIANEPAPRPAGTYPYAEDPKLRFDQRRLARVVGFIALGMPIVLGLGGEALGRFRTALSAYYYEPYILGDLFVGALMAIGALLMAYRGSAPRFAHLATAAGIAAFVVALVPMSGWVTGCAQVAPDGECAVRSVRYADIGQWVHAAAAGGLFAILAYFCLFVFTRIPQGSDSEHGPTRAKRSRNAIYIVSGIVIAVATIAIAIGTQFAGEWWDDANLTYWAEAVILTAFGISWLVQGRAVKALADPRDLRDAAYARELTA